MKIFYSLFLILTFNFLFAQLEKNIDHQSLFWSRYYNQLSINSQWSIHTEFDSRIFLNPLEENQYVFRIQGRYKVNKNIEIGAGFSYFSVATQNPEITYPYRIPEYRGQQDITWKQEYCNFTLNQRFQIEERFIQNSNKEELLPNSTFFWRFRYRLQGEYLFSKKQSSFLKLIVYDELMINAGENIVYNTFDQNRIYGAMQYGFNKNISLELGYLKSFQQRASGLNYYNRDIIRFTLYHKIFLN
ncbi:MAG TPA: DUF2490 domain-containing protein [Flavobacterium sp.]|jgi:hypothetical protein|nr:DUF2490 domain-containing protein [Flavobacterium sp.]